MLAERVVGEDTLRNIVAGDDPRRAPCSSPGRPAMLLTTRTSGTPSNMGARITSVALRASGTTVVHHMLRRNVTLVRVAALAAARRKVSKVEAEGRTRSLFYP